MTWKQIEPELYYHAERGAAVASTNEERIRNEGIRIAQEVFKDIYEETVEFEVLVEEGSIKLRIIATVGAVAIFLTKYGDIRSGIDYFAHDIKAGYTLARLSQICQERIIFLWKCGLATL